MDPQPWRGPLDPDETGAKPEAHVRIQAVICGRCGWPNACRIQSGMRTLRFMCQWCDRMTTGIVDPSIKRNVIF
jgi:transcription elongation factor Elf1